MKTRAVLAAAVAAASVATAACSSTVAGSARRAPGTVRAPAAATAAPVRGSASSGWISVEGEPGPARTGALEPGARIVGVNMRAVMASCTLGPRLAGDAIATAGHCGQAGSPRFLAVDGPEVGQVEQSVDKVPNTGDDHPVLDFAAVKLTVPVSVTPVRLTGRPVAGVFTKEAIQALRPGTPVCFLGAESGLRCGQLIRADSQAVLVDVPGVNGDSGAPVFVVDGHTQTVTLLGLLKGPFDGWAGATYLDADLGAARAEALVDAAAATVIATGDPDYSTRVSPR